MAEARSSSLIPSQGGLFAAQDLDEGTLVPQRSLHLGYSVQISREKSKRGTRGRGRETWSKVVEFVTPEKGWQQRGFRTRRNGDLNRRVARPHTDGGAWQQHEAFSLQGLAHG